MLKLISSFLNIPVISIYNSSKIGFVTEYIIDPESGKVVGVIAGKYGVFVKKNLVISGVDIREISLKALVVDSEESLVKQKEIMEIDKIIKSGKKVMKAKVYSQSEKYLGKVYDYLVDEFFFIKKLYIYPPFLNVFENQLIISRKNIIEIRKNGIIINDDNRKIAKEPKTVKTIL